MDFTDWDFGEKGWEHDFCDRYRRQRHFCRNFIGGGGNIRNDYSWNFEWVDYNRRDYSNIFWNGKKVSNLEVRAPTYTTQP